MAQRFCPLPLRPARLAFCLCAGLVLPSLAATRLAAAAPAKADAAPACRSPSACRSLVAKLSALPDAQAAEEWLAQTIPVGTALADAPEFFADADEVFFDAEADQMVFVYRSSHRGRWIAWISFDSERVGVVHTAAADL